MTPFAVTDTKFYFILGMPFFEKHIQKIKIQIFTMNFKFFSNNQPTTASFTILIEKKISFFLVIHQLTSKQPIYFKPNTVRTLHFPLKKSKTLVLETENQKPLFAEMSQSQ